MFEDEKDDLDLDDEIEDDDLDLDDEDDDIDDDADEDPEKDEEGDKDKDDEDDQDKDEEPEESVEELKKKLIKRTAMLKRYQKRAKQLEESKANSQPPAKQSKKKEEEARSEDSLKEQRFDFRVDNPHLKSKEVDQIERYAKANGLSFAAAARSPVIKIYIDKRLKARKLAESSASSGSGGRGNLTKPKKDWLEVSDEDFEKHLKSRPH